MKQMWSKEEISSQKKDISTLVDSKGNPRFVEGTGTPATIEGFTSTYCKWSLSGTHLMCVLAGSIANNTAVAANTNLVAFPLPVWIANKINPIWANRFIAYRNENLYGENGSTQNIGILFLKGDNGEIIFKANPVTLTLDRSFRIQFDLLIDSE